MHTSDGHQKAIASYLISIFHPRVESLTSPDEVRNTFIVHFICHHSVVSELDWPHVIGIAACTC